MAEIIKFPEEPTPDECLEVMKGKLEEVVILGVTEDGSIWINGNLGVAEALLMISMGYKVMLEEAMGEDDIAH